ncbi:F-box domain-containing protein [Favolaschia claudopus]|uniref:F-box domain-containing protein n=1 Tax=Favolaschia claudopus TaxID=2862362 RepID=A0AAW0AVU3_9AGAR
MLERLAEDRARISELDSQILDLERALSVLRSQRSVVKERLDAYKYPVLTLPNEVIAEIFVHYIPKYPACPPLAGIQSPILLTHICRLWRGIALATPKLWRAVSLSSRSRFSLNPKNIWLSRAGRYPLAIRMNETDGFTVDDPSLSNAFLSHRTRCEYLELRFGNYLPLLGQFGGDFSLLKHLDLEIDEQPHVKIEFPRAPMLRSVVLDVFAARWIVLPWSQLTTLALHTISLESCVPVLEKAVNLSECHLKIVINDENYIAHPRIMLPHLKSLKAYCDGLPMNTFLDSFTLPLLSKLDVCEELLGLDCISSLRTFISRSECKLQYLRIFSMNSDSANSYSAAFPSIQEVTLGTDEEYEHLQLLWHFLSS